MTITFIRWRDACTEEAVDGQPIVPALAELCEVGFLLGETDEVVTIGMEHPVGDVKPGRWRLHVAKSAIIERRDVDMKSFMRRGRRS